MNKADGMNYAPTGKPDPVCEKGDFVIAAMALEHGHIYGMCNGLLEAGGELRYVYDPDPDKVAAFCEHFPDVQVLGSEAEVLARSDVHMVAAAAVPCDRGPLGIRMMESGKDYFTDKTPFTSLDQLAEARTAVQQTGRKYMVYYSERLHTESSVFADQLVQDGAIGRVVQVMGLGPHRLNAPARPDWFWKRDKYGGILCDIGSHQTEQFLHFTGAKDATIRSAAVANYNHPDYPEFEDFGETTLTADNGAAGYFRIDWFTPDGLSIWGDGRLILLGTDGYIELRKYVDVARTTVTDQVYLVDHKGEHHFSVAGTVGFPFFGQLILDCLNRTDKAMTQEHAFKAAELCLIAQDRAVRLA